MEKERRKNIIISADDFGVSHQANKNILALVKLGKINRIAVMTQGFLSAQEIEALKKTNVKIDLHLDLADHIPLKRTLRAGIFFRTAKFLFAHIHDRLNAKRKKLHFEKQLQKFQEIFGQNPDGINSHQHIHFFPFYFKIVLQLAQKNKIKFIRFGQKGILENSNKIGQILKFLHKQDLKHFLKTNLSSSDYVLSLDWLNQNQIKKELALLPKGKIEIICHPERPEEMKILKQYL